VGWSKSWRCEGEEEAVRNTGEAGAWKGGGGRDGVGGR